MLSECSSQLKQQKYCASFENTMVALFFCWQLNRHQTFCFLKKLIKCDLVMCLIESFYLQRSVDCHARNKTTGRYVIPTFSAKLLWNEYVFTFFQSIFVIPSKKCFCLILSFVFLFIKVTLKFIFPLEGCIEQIFNAILS